MLNISSRKTYVFSPGGDGNSLPFPKSTTWGAFHCNSSYVAATGCCNSSEWNNKGGWLGVVVVVS